MILYELSGRFLRAITVLKSNGTKPNMHCSESCDTRTHSNFWAATLSPRAVKVYSVTLGLMTRTYHVANLAVFVFMFFRVSTFLLRGILADRVWPPRKRSDRSHTALHSLQNSAHGAN